MKDNKHIRIKLSGVIKYFYYFKRDYRIFQWILTKRGFTKEFRILNGINFEVHDGEIVGILGANGAGKSTLLKLIAGVYHQNTGSIMVDGKVSSLLELGAGFNPILTGRENIYFKGSILGMKKEEIDEKIEDIIEFADIGEYIDMPLASYSSGMGARLGFALAVNVDPDILIIDEVFAVGDRDFQQKSKSRTMEFFEQGKTILFVSHSEELIRNFCTRVIYLNNGFIQFDGDVEEGIEMYHKTLSQSSKEISLIFEQFKVNNGNLEMTFEFGRRYQNKIFEAITFDEMKPVVCKYNTVDNIVHDEGFASLSYELLDDRHIEISIPISEIVGQSFCTINTLLTQGDKLTNMWSHIYIPDDEVEIDGVTYIIRKRANRLAFEVSKHK